MSNYFSSVALFNLRYKLSDTLYSKNSILMLKIHPINNFVRFVSASSNHYDVLGVKHKASSEDIRSAFLKLSKEYHPDLNQKDPGNHTKFVQINEAYSILGKPLIRREYDIKLSLDKLSNDKSQADKSIHRNNTHSKQNMNFDEYEHFNDPYIQYARNAQKYSNQGRNGKKKKSVLFCCLFMFVGPIIWILSMKLNPDKRYLSRRGLSHGFLGEAPANNFKADEQFPKR